MKPRVLILGAGFGGLELSTCLSEAMGDGVDITLIDQADAFVLGYSKLDVMFGRETPTDVRCLYTDFIKPGVTFKRETVTAIDAATRTVTTDAGIHTADALVIALGADYDTSTTPGVVLGKNEFYSIPGAEYLRGVVPKFRTGHAVIGVCGAPYKCPPAPSECALMLHDHLVAQGLRKGCQITFVHPLPVPVPPSPDTSKALLGMFAKRGIVYMPNRRIESVDDARHIVTLDGGEEMSCDLFLGVPKHRAPDVVIASGMAKDGWVPVDPFTLETAFPGVYAIGDLAETGGPKAGVFAESAARAVAANLASRFRGEEPTAKNPRAGSCYIEFGANLVARVDVEFSSGTKPVGTFHAPSEALREDKKNFGTVRRARWFGR